ncbi:MAG: 50S ribosomal protein L13 [Anaerolineae bacterium]|nr:50S ribosomal protein L13 [Anaerolineae bacterium]PKO03108.1 MAG: 50S ribosomal protein L13 [Chloroflexi bacterium HGW-Chloroflexi-5]HCS39744.1 50S ribosomal protein L13 [Anaerolineaceae bacterium]
MDKTYVLKGRQEPEWLLIDAAGQGIGRLSTQIANYLLGKHKPSFTPGVEMGDVVVVINVDKLAITQKKLETKNYYKHSGYPGGLKTVGLKEQMRVHPDRVITAAVWGMLPHNRMGRSIFKRLKVYAGSEHPHAAQNPKPVA